MDSSLKIIDILLNLYIQIDRNTINCIFEENVCATWFMSEITKISLLFWNKVYRMVFNWCVKDRKMFFIDEHKSTWLYPKQWQQIIHIFVSNKTFWNHDLEGPFCSLYSPNICFDHIPYQFWNDQIGCIGSGGGVIDNTGNWEMVTFHFFVSLLRSQYICSLRW